MNRQQRRATAARQRTRIKKHTPFGRVAVIDVDTGDITRIVPLMSAYDQAVYAHITRGRTNRRLSDPLINRLLSVG